MNIPNKEIKIIFAGSDEFSIPIFKKLIESFTVVGLISEPDKPAGRGQKLVSPPIIEIAKQYNIKIWQPEKIRTDQDTIDDIGETKPQLLVTASYGQIVPNELINLPLMGSINVHPSILPLYRGASPIQTALLNGDNETAVSIIKMTDKLDAGDILSQKIIPIEINDNFFTLRNKLAEASAELLTTIIPDYIKNQLTLIEQNDSLATFTKKTNKEDGLIDWNRSNIELHNQVRALIHWPTASTTFNNQKFDIIETIPAELSDKNKKPGEVFKINKDVFVTCGNGALQLIKVKLAGKKELSARDFINGQPKFIGAVLGQ